MTREEAIRWLEDIHRRFNPTRENLENEGGDVHLQALDMAIEALKAKTDGDLISRQGALDAIMGEPTDAHYPSWYAQRIKLLPSAEPKTGEWVWSDEDASWMCGACCCVFEEIDWKPNYNFCPNCGARMDKGGEDE